MITRGIVRLGSVAGLLAVSLMSATIFASNQHAQSPPMTLYGTANAGDKVDAIIGGKVCVSVTALADGFWQMQIPEGGKCNARDSATIRFILNGAVTGETEIWRWGGAPKNVATGVTLTTTSVVTGATLTIPSATPQKTGSPGLLPSGRSSPWFAIMLGAFALAGLAGARAMTGRRS